MKLNPKDRVVYLLLFAGCIAFGASIWIASPYFTGQKEPWDSLNFYYRGCLLLGGFSAGFLLPRRFWLWAVAIWLGQVVYFFWCMYMASRVGPLAPLGFIVFLPLYGLWSLFGAFLGAQAGRLFRRFILGRTV